MIFNDFLNEQDNHILWLPIIFILGCFIGFNFCIKLYIYIAIVFTSFFLFVIFNKHLIKYLFLIILFLSLGSFRTNIYINNYKYPEINYNIGKVRITGKIVDKLLKIQSNSNLLRYITIDVDSIEPINKNSKFSKDNNFRKPKFIRIKMLDNIDIEYGTVLIEANVLPIQNKNFDSDFDLQMYFYFKKIGGIGYNGKIIKYLEKTNKLTLKQKLSDFREKIAIKILSNRKNGLSINLLSVIMIGQRNLADKNMLEIMNKSGLSHIMSISGLQMMILTYFVIFFTKQIFCLHYDSFNRYNVYKISAIFSIFINTLYMILVGFNISSTRAYIMNIIMLIGILLDRFNSPIRSLMFAMFIMVLVKPNIIYRSGFYMSFLSSMAIISFINYIYTDKYEESNYYKNGLYGYVKMSITISFIIELVILPIEIYSFNILNFCNILTNIIINPLMLFIIVPFGLISFLLIPFGLEKIILLPLSYLIDGIIILAKTLSKLKFGTIFLQSPSVFVIILMILGIIWLSLWSQNWRKFGIIIYTIGIFIIFTNKNIDVIIDNRSKMLFFVDEKKNVYVYNVNKYRVTNILNKLGNNKYFDLKESHLNTCKGKNDKHCSKIYINDNRIIFYKNGNYILIGKYKGNFYIKDRIGNMNVKKTRKNSQKPVWKKCKYYKISKL